MRIRMGIRMGMGMARKTAPPVQFTAQENPGEMIREVHRISIRIRKMKMTLGTILNGFNACQGASAGILDLQTEMEDHHLVACGLWAFCVL